MATMDTQTWIVAGIAAIALFAALRVGMAIGRRSHEERGLSGPPAPRATPGRYLKREGGLAQALPADLIQSVEEALARGQKIEAIKLVRDGTGMGLKEAKDFVEALERGR